MNPENADIWSITQLTRRVKFVLEREVGDVWVTGEITNWKLAGSGHAYFTLKDAECQIDAVMFKGPLGRVRFSPENGLEVLAHGRVTAYERRCGCQIVLDSMQPKGAGALQLAFEKLKKKLADEGLFDESRKKPIPVLPRRIGIVTSPTGAAIRDILNVLGRRFANVHILLYPARVQGDGAAAEIAAGIRALDAWGVDVMIVGRGGGSMEDLWPFNEEATVRAVAAAHTPIISAVGHEIDFTLTDFAADLRAPTPSAAAELVVREQSALAEKVAALRQRLGRGMTHYAERARRRLEAARGSFAFRRPEELLRQKRQSADELRMRIEDAANDFLMERRRRVEKLRGRLDVASPVTRLRLASQRLAALRVRLPRESAALVARARARLGPAAGRLHALSPLAILGRGYALAWKVDTGALVRDAAQLASGDTVRLRFGAGAVRAAVTTVEEGNDG